MKALILISTLIFAGCATQQPQIGTRYALDGAGNLVQEQYVVADKGGACDASGINWCVVGAIGVGVLIGVWGLDRIYGDDDEPAPAQQPSNGLVTVGGSSSSEWTSDVIYPSYTRLPAAE